MVLYATELADTRLAELEQVVGNAINHATKFPTIAELRADYRHECERVAQQDALPLGREPMPPHVKRAWREALGKMDERAGELEGGR